MEFSNHDSIVIFDVETSGLNPNQDKIIEFGAVVLRKEGQMFKKDETINVIVNIKEPLNETIKNITNITDEMVSNGIEYSELLDIVESLLSDNPLLVAYNLPFDVSFLRGLFKYFGKDHDVLDQCDVLDMLTVYRDKHPYPHKLDHAVEKYDISVQNTHRALDDALATYELLETMHAKHDITSFINVIGYLKKYPYKGKKYPHITYIAQ